MHACMHACIRTDKNVQATPIYLGKEVARLEDPGERARGDDGAANQNIGCGEVVQQQLLRAPVSRERGVRDGNGHVPLRAGEGLGEGPVPDVEGHGALEGGLVQDALVGVVGVDVGLFVC